MQFYTRLFDKKSLYPTAPHYPILEDFLWEEIPGIKLIIIEKKPGLIRRPGLGW